MKVHELMTPDAVYCRPTDSLRSAARTLGDRDIGALPVAGASGQVVGMLTDRDICLAAWQYDRPLSQLRVSGAMSRGIIYSCRPEDEVHDAEEVMAVYKLRRLPVVDRLGHLVGFLSQNDLVQAAASGRGVSEAETLETLAAIGEPGPAKVPGQS